MCEHKIDISNFCMLCGEEILLQPVLNAVRYKPSSYERRLIYFNKIVECYTGAQVFEDTGIIQAIKNHLHMYYGNAMITQHHILITLKYLKLTKFNDNSYLLYCLITHKKIRCLDRFLIATIQRMFEDFLIVFLELYPNSNFINVRFVLQKFLIMFNVFNEPPLYCFKSLDTKYKQEHIYRICFTKLNLASYTFIY